MNKNYSKNSYYTEEDIKKAKQLAKQFYNGDYTPKMFSHGNLKLGDNVAIFNMPVGVTCKCRCKDCYAIKPERFRLNTRIQRAFHYEVFELAKNDTVKMEYLKNYVINEIRYYNQLYKNFCVRIHEAGDFYCKEYLNFWLDIVSRCSDILFYTYTKQLNEVDIDTINNNYNNLNIIKSILDNGCINFGDDDYIQGVEKYLQASKQQYYICTWDNKQSGYCMTQCNKCLYCDKVLFIKH